MSRHKQPLTAATANPNAASAAAAVFKRNEAQQASNLSAAAAAAALRARPITPTNVAEVQTKRTVRRSASVASTRTNPETTRGRPDLRRSGSSSSMTERTFRSPSPHRSESRNSGRRQSQSIEELPPVPELPKNVATTVGTTTGTGAPSQKSAHRRTQSLGVERAPSQKQLQGVDDVKPWFGPAKVGDLSSVRKTDPAMASPPSSPPQVAMHQEDRPNSRASSVNFSYPARVRVGSPPVSPADTRSTTDFPAQDSQSAVQPQRSRGSLLLEPGTPSTTRPRASSASAADQTLVYDPNSRRMIRRSDLIAVEHAIIAASQQPTRTKKQKKHYPKAGSHLAQGTVGRTKSNVPTSDLTGNTGTTTTTRTTAPQVQVPAPVQQSPAIQNSRQEIQERPPSPAAVPLTTIEPQPTEQQEEEDSDVEDEEEEDVIADHHHPTASTPMVVTKDGRPMVRRLPSIVKEEPELEESDSDENTSRVSGALDSVPSRQRIVSHTRSQSEQQPIQSSSQANQLPIRAASVSQRKSQPTRNSSLSPARQAHFGPVQDTLTVRHSPPPRSVSPRKSALKQTSPARGPSPSDLSSEASWSTDQPVKRKKSVRVSFDDETQPAIIVEAAPEERSISPPMASPTGIRRWANADSSAALDNEDLMKPRPALPSFGSVRNVRKPQQLETKEDERPLRPIGDVSYTAPYTTPLPLSPVAESFAQSSDHAIGGVLQREREERVRSPANISRFREPLPPVVTSVEGGGYASDDSDGSTSLASEMTGSLYDYPSFMDPPPQPRRNSVSSPQVSPVKTAFPNGNTPAIDSRFAQEEARRRNSAPNIPIISLTQPTPPATQTEAPRPFFVEVPGGFPEDSDTSKSSAGGVESAAGQQTTGTQSQQVSESETDDSSVYADAYEDLSEAEGEGFQSLNAVLDFPEANNNNSRQQEIPDTPTPPDPPRSLVPALSTATTAIGSHSGESPQEDDWERAKAYWRSLTAERRAQLEREAKEDAAIEGDREEISVPVEKPRRKKSIERRNSERQALAVQMARQMMLEQQQQQQQLSRQEEEQPRKKKKGKSKATAAPAPAPARVSPERTYQIKPGTKWEEPEVPVAPVASTMTMRTTMRSAPPQSKVAVVNDGPRLRKSMRSEPPTDRRASYPDPAPVPATPQLTKRERRAASEAAAAPRASTIRLASTHQSHIKRRGSTSSESSFKRARASSAGGGLSTGGFRTSLRPKSPAAGSVDSRGSGTKLLTSLRSMTPTNSNSRLADTPPSSRGTMGSGMGMRTTLRGEPAANSGSGGRRSPGGMKMPTLGGKKAAGGKKRSSTGSKFSSRFGDSSDEEDVGTGSRFRSRFDESSDEEEVVPPVPVVPSGLKGSSASAPVAAAARSMALGSMRDKQVSIAEEEDYGNGVVNGNGNARGSIVGGGHHKLSKTARLGSAIPSRQQAGYDDEEEVAAGNEELRRTRSGRGQILPTSQTAPNVTPAAGEQQHRPKRGLMSVFSRKKQHHQESADAIARPEAPVESAARKDTKLERSKAELQSLRNQGPVDQEQDQQEANVAEERLRTPATIDTNNTSEISPRSQPHPRLQKRGSRMPSFSLPGRHSEKSPPPTEEATNGGGIPMPGFIRRSGTVTGPNSGGSLGTRSISGGSGANGPFAAVPGLGPRRASTATALSVAAGTGTAELPERAETPTSSGGKKKKFGSALRRMFGRGDKEGSG
ncbi:hypothetical protein B0T20DRAFT_89322 [Sordaria brevicollis]|uniref:Uncharacterized protein n=1 Tax=Sordaria brevicollis TaxID=83679 RepID=A0AAE0NWC5_SORBR|nr:hypothetical protein B0T20DRAFT_89322 [Sordaria brevicollis]